MTSKMINVSGIFKWYVRVSRFKEVIGLGNQLVGSNPALTDVAETTRQLAADQEAIAKGMVIWWFGLFTAKFQKSLISSNFIVIV